MTSRNNLQSNIFGKFTDQKDIPILPPMGSEEVLSEMAHIRIEELGSSISEKPIAGILLSMGSEEASSKSPESPISFDNVESPSF
jgi:hypothetical protein